MRSRRRLLPPLLDRVDPLAVPHDPHCAGALAFVAVAEGPPPVSLSSALSSGDNTCCWDGARRGKESAELRVDVTVLRASRHTACQRAAPTFAAAPSFRGLNSGAVTALLALSRPEDDPVDRRTSVTTAAGSSSVVSVGAVAGAGAGRTPADAARCSAVERAARSAPPRVTALAGAPGAVTTAAGWSSVANVAISVTGGSRGTACTCGDQVCAVVFLAVLVVGMLNRKSRGRVAVIEVPRSERRGFTSSKWSSS
eukprot:scaffold66387_cov81-Phaeocystis_antarctica.AAC.2